MMDQPVVPRSAEHLLLEIVKGAVHDLRTEAPASLRPTLDSSLERDFGFDSLARVELSLRIERAFGIELPEDAIQRAETVRDLLSAVEHAPKVGPMTADIVAPAPASQREPDAGTPDAAATLLQVLDWHLQTHADQVQIVILAEGAQHEISYAQLAAGARSIGSALQRAGLQPRQSVAIMLPTSTDYFETYLGVLMAGGIPVPIYPPARASQLEDHVLRHARILDNAQAAILITVPEAVIVARLLQARVHGLRHMLTPQQLKQSTSALAPVDIEGDHIAFIQYTSGSTGNPKGVTLTHANLLANIRAMKHAIAANARDVFVSWLPLYHDMGLIGAFLGSLYVGFPLIVMSPLAFLARPERWLWAIHRYRGTLSAAPNFAYELCLKRVDDAAIEGLDLSSWRLAFNGAEAVSADTVERFAQRFSRYGLRREAIAPVYGLAEAAVGLLFPPLSHPPFSRGPLIDRVQRERFTREACAIPAAADDPAALRFVACGQPLAGHEVRIVNDKGSEVGERVEGRLEFKGPSATQGYFRNPGETARLFHDGWLDSGDRAYRANGDIYVTGRVKDIIKRAGRNIYPQEIEEAVSNVVGVRKGCVAVFGVADPRTGTERLVVLAETHLTESGAREQLRITVSSVVVNVLGEPADEIALVEPHTVLKTSSGKLRRSACRALYEEGRLGARLPTARNQLARLALGALASRVRFVAAAVRRGLFGLYAAFVFWMLALPTWLSTLLTRTPVTAWKLGRAGVHLLLKLIRIPLTVRGLEHLPKDRACVLVSNHASYIDGLILVAALPLPYAFVAKRELRDQFFARQYLSRLGAEFVERFDVKRSVADANRLAEVVAQGRSLIVFPEGTFTAQSRLLPFHLGAFLAAASAGVPIVPVTIRGSRDVLPAGRWLPRRYALDVEIGAPLLSAQQETADVLSGAVRLREAARTQIEHNLEPSAA